jgi:hypothetical protein
VAARPTRPRETGFSLKRCDRVLSFRCCAAAAAAGVAALGAYVGAAGAAGAPPPEPIHAYANPVVIEGLRARPTELVMSADGNGYITELSHWVSWGEAYSTARGLNHVNDCDPNCADGHVSKIPVTVTLSRPGIWRGHFVYECYTVKPGATYLRHLCLPRADT